MEAQGFIRPDVAKKACPGLPMCLAIIRPSLCPKGAVGLSPGLNGANIRVVWDDLFTEVG
jgi:hypothetical protein